MSTSNTPLARTRKLSSHVTGFAHPRPAHGRTWVINAGASPYRVRFIESGRPGGPRKARFIDVDTNKTVIRMNANAAAAPWPSPAVLHELLRLTDPLADLGDLPTLDKLAWLVNVTPAGFTLGLAATGISPWPRRAPLPADPAKAGQVAKKLMRAMANPDGPAAADLAKALNS